MGLLFPLGTFPKKFHPDPSTFYLVIVVTNKQTERQTNAGKNIIPRFRGDNKFLDTLQKNFLIQHVQTATRVRGSDTPHVLDLVITDTNDIIDDIEILSPLGKSDHAILNIKCQSVLHREDNSTSKYNYSKGDYEKLRNSLHIDWVHVFNSFGNDVDKMWDYFKNELLLNVQKYIPVASNFRQWKKPSWKCPVSVNLQGLIKKKSRLWKRFIETRNPQTHKEYKKVRNKIRKQTHLIIKKNSVKLQNNANIIQRNFGNMLTVSQENKLEMVILNLMVVMEIFW